ncbi:MAG: hypothetical protein ACOCSJ_04835 [Candidatus Natronoplasma sp.]
MSTESSVKTFLEKEIYSHGYNKAFSDDLKHTKQLLSKYKKDIIITLGLISSFTITLLFLVPVVILSYLDGTSVVVIGTQKYAGFHIVHLAFIGGIIFLLLATYFYKQQVTFKRLGSEGVKQLGVFLSLIYSTLILILFIGPVIFQPYMVDGTQYVFILNAFNEHFPEVILVHLLLFVNLYSIFYKNKDFLKDRLARLKKNFHLIPSSTN